MGRAFNRLEKQVAGRRAPRSRYQAMPVRLRNLEVLLLEVASYLATEVATDGLSEKDTGLTAAVEEFRKALEETL